MKVRKLLETSSIIMGGFSSTLNNKIIAKAIQVLGENQSLRGYDDVDRVLLDSSKDMTPSDLKALSKEDRAAIAEKTKEAKRSKHSSDVSNPKSAIYRAHQIFIPRVLKYLYVETGISRSSGEVRHILSHYALNFLGTMVQRLHPILNLAKRCTVMVKDVEVANSSTTHSSSLLGFGSSVHKRVDPERSQVAKEIAATRSKARKEKPPVPVAPDSPTPAAVSSSAVVPFTPVVAK
jgi:histone H3/H4